MRKLLSIVLALTLVLGMLPVFANDFAQEDLSPAENLKHYKFLEGNEEGDLLLDKTISRQEFAIVIARMLGKDDEASKFEAETEFADKDTFKGWAKNYIAYVAKEGYMVGDNNMFIPMGTVSSKEAATVFLRLLGYNEDEDFKYADAVTFLNDKGVEIKDADKLVREDLFNAMWVVVSTPVMKEEGKILGVHHGMLPEPAPKFVPIAINEVKADNLKEIMVTFNQAINKDEIGTFALANNELTAELMEDGMTVKLTAKTALKNQKEYTLVIEKTAAVDELAGTLAKEERKFNVFDATLPKVESVEFSGPRNLVITFSEPMKDVKGTISVKAGNTTVSVNTSKIAVMGNKVVAETYTMLTESTEYTVQVSKFQDLAGYENVNYSNNVTFSKDANAPTVKVVSATPTSVVVEFSKPVTGAKASMFWHSFTAWNAVELRVPGTATIVNASDLVTKVEAVFYKGAATDKALPEGNVKVGVSGANIKDLWGNKLGEFEETVAVKADTEKPVAKAEKKDAENIAVTFSKDVLSVTAADHVTVLDKDNKKITPIVITGSGKKFNIKLPNQEGKTVTLKISGVQDTTPNKNTMVAFDEMIAFGDTVAPYVVSITRSKDPATKHITLYFQYDDSVTSEALIGANYKVKDAMNNYISLKDLNGEFADVDNLVRFVVPFSSPESDLYKAINQAAPDFIVENVKDLANNLIAVKVKTAEVMDAGQDIAIVANGIVATYHKNADDTIVTKITINTDSTIKALDKATEFTLSNGTKLVNPSFSGKEVVFYTDKVLPSDLVGITMNVPADAIMNNFGKFVVADATATIVDKMGPAVVKVEADSAARTITITFTEDLKNGVNAAAVENDIKLYFGDKVFTSFATDMYKVAYANTAAAATYALTLDAAAQLEGDFVVEAKEPMYVVDNSAAANVIRKFKQTVKADFKGAQVVSVTTTAANTGTNSGTVVVVFDSELDETSAENTANYTLDVTNPTTATLEADKKTVTLTFAASYQNDKNLVIKTTSVKDSNNAVFNKDFTYKLTNVNDTIQDGNNVWTLQ